MLLNSRREGCEMQCYHVAMFCLHCNPYALAGTKSIGGMNIYVKQIAQELVKNGCRVDVYTRKFSPSQALTTQVQANIRLIHIDDGDARPLDKTEVMKLVPDFTDQVDQFVSREDLRYDIMHCHHYHAGEACLLLRKRGGRWDIPIVLMYHSIGTLECPEDGRTEAERRIAHLVECIIAATPQDKDDIARYCDCDPGKIMVIPCGVDLKLFCPQNQAEVRKKLNLPSLPHPVGIFVGRIDPVKNIEGIISALAIIKREEPESNVPTILIVGGSSEEEREKWEEEQSILDRHRKDLGVQDSIVFMGSLTHDKLASYYNAANFHLMPSHYESFGLSALEALASGIPSIGTLSGGTAHIIRDGIDGYLVDPKDHVALASKILLLAQNPEKSRMEEKGLLGFLGVKLQNNFSTYINY